LRQTTGVPYHPEMKTALFVVFLILATAGGAAAQASLEQAPANEPSSAPVKASAESMAAARQRQARSRTASQRDADAAAAQSVFRILAAEIAAQRGQTAVAAATWLAVARETRNPKAAQRATELAVADRNNNRIIESAEFWLELEPQAPAPAQTLETIWLGTGQFQRAEALLVKQLAAARKGNRAGEVYGPLSRNLLRATDRSAAVALLDRLSEPDLNEPSARVARATLAHAAGDALRARNELQAAISLSPQSEEIALAAATILPSDAAGRREAIALLQAFVAGQSSAPRARFTLARLHAIDGRLDEALDQLQRTLVDDPEDPSTLFAAAQLARELRRPDQAETLMLRWVELPGEAGPERNQGWLFLASVAESRGQLDKAIGHLEKVAAGDGRFEAALFRAILTGRLKRPDEARAILRATAAESPRERAQLAQTEAEILRDEGRTADAFAVLGNALTAQPDDPQLLYDQAMLAERLNQLEVTEANLRRLIALRPNHAHAYNALGYTFAERNMRLDEAKTLIERAIQLAPQDPQIIDSMGWVEFRLGRPEAALEWLQRAWTIRPDAEIGAHLGEVLWSLGRRDEAQRIWREANGQDPTNALLRETRLRLGVAW